jgi:hypothetical protein
MNATDLQAKLATLALGETLLLSTIEVERAFLYERTSENRRAVATALAALYRCRLAFCGPSDSQALFTRGDHLELRDFA